MKINTLAATALAVSAFGGMAHAASGASTYYFTGDCTDCGADHDATGVLQLQDYSPGTPLTAANVVSFTYNSSMFTNDGIAQPFVDSASGSLGQKTGFYDTSFTGKSVNGFPFSEASFQSDTQGGWSFLVNDIDFDHGVDGTWSADAPVSSAPEPDAWALLVGGVAAMGLGLRATRRRQSGRAFA